MSTHEKMQELLSELQDQRMNTVGDQARYIAICITELEKIMALYYVKVQS